jgi:hypothetical protein
VANHPLYSTACGRAPNHRVGTCGHGIQPLCVNHVFIWRYKPFGVEYATIIPLEISVLRTLRRSMGRTGHTGHEGFNPLSSQRVDRGMYWDIFVYQAAVRDARGWWRRAKATVIYPLGTVFSAFHLAAWNWEFPSPISRTLWRTSGVLATAIPPFTLFIVRTEPTFPFKYMEPRFKNLFLLCLVLLYLFARLTLVVLVFYCFSSMPSAVYSGISWVNDLPHFA